MGRLMEKVRDGRGQAVVEFALIVPLLVILLATAVDAGRYIVSATTSQAAADTLARQVETTPAMTQAAAQEFVEDHYPDLKGRVTVEIESPVRVVDKTYEHHIFDPRDSLFKTRQSRVAQDAYLVHVVYKGAWVTPGLIVAASLVDADGGFTQDCTATAVVDKTIEEWDRDGA